MHMDKLEEWLPDQDSRYDTLLRYGWALDRQLECCVNNMHIEALKDPSSGLPEGSFSKPLLASTEFAALLAATDSTLSAQGLRMNVETLLRHFS